MEVLVLKSLMTQGAAIHSQRNAARKVRVRQRPCGTLATRRVPRGERPCRRGHVRLGPGLVDEHQASGTKPTLVLLPPGAATRDVGAILLGGAERVLWDGPLYPAA